MARRTCSSNPLRMPHPKIDKLACQAKGVGILAIGEITLRTKLNVEIPLKRDTLYHNFLKKAIPFSKFFK